MRILAFLAILLPACSAACTAFTTTHNGRTFIGCNEDSWSINANLRFEQGRDGGYGVLYFAHYNGHPMREMADQMGMNEAGLVFDGLVVGPGAVKRRGGMPIVATSEAIRHIMRTCAAVQEVESYLRSVDTGPLVGMLYFADAAGGYLLLEPDTLFTGNDPWYAVSNWRMSTCGDPSTIPIPRLQDGRAMLANGMGTSFTEARDVLARMGVCRPKLGEGTLFSALFDPREATAHLFFYHDFNEHVTFHLKEELATGDRTVDMASLFGPRPEYERLKRYITPFHQRWLFWALCSLAVLALLLGTVNLMQLIARLVAKLRGRSSASLITPLLSGLANATLIALIGVLLMQEGVFYFGLGFVHPALAALPWFLLLVKVLLFLRLRRHRDERCPLLPALVLPLPVLVGCAYWGFFLPH